MITAIKPILKDFEYHRNGVGGRGFFAFVVEATYPLRDGSFEEKKTMLCTWFPPEGFGSKDKEDRKDSGLDQWDPGYEVAFVVLTAMGPDTSDHQRGDCWMDHIKSELVKAYKEKYS